jgi:uridylate kinase
MKEWNNEVNEVLRLVDEIVKRIDKGIKVVVGTGKVFRNDICEVFLIKEDKKRKVIISFEDLVNEPPDYIGLENRLRNAWEAEPEE